MTQSIKVLARYRDFPMGQFKDPAVLLVFTVADDNPIVTTAPAELEKHDLSVKFIHAVEVFSTLDPNNPDESGAASFFFSTIHKDSTLKAQRFKSDKPFWMLVREDGAVIPFRPKLKLDLKLRSPLLWAKRDSASRQEDEAKVSIRFEFDDVDVSGQRQANKNKCVSFTASDSSDKLERKENEGFDLTELTTSILTATHWRDHDHFWAPKLLLFDSFNLGPPPLGRHYYTMSFVELPNQQPNTRKKYGLKFGYNCVRHDPFKGWGTDEASASRLWPLGIAPLGNYQIADEVPPPNLRKYDIVAKQTSADVDQVEWQFKVYSYSDKSNFQSFTPLGFWNERIADRYGQALSTTRGHDPGSIIPRFQGESLDSRFEWLIHYDVIDTAPHSPFKEQPGEHDPAEWLKPEEFIFGLQDEPLSLVKESETATVQLSNFQVKDGTPLVRTLRFANVGFKAFGSDEIDIDDGGPGFSLTVHDLANATLPPDAPQARVGALDLHFLPPGDKAVEGQDEQGQITTMFQGLGRFQKGNAELNGRRSPRFKTWQPAVNADLILQLGAFGPGDQDPLPTEGTRAESRRVSSIIVPVDTEKSLLKSAFLLVAAELATRSVNHSLRLRLERGGVATITTENADGFDLVVLDTEPFLISRVIAPMELTSALEIGNWTGDSPDGASWELKDLGGGFDLLLPPQATGEEFIRKYDEQSTAKPLDYRFAPPGFFKLSRTPFKQSFSEAPWNLRRLLGFPGQRQPGMGVYSLRFELLYGLTTMISTDPSDLNLTELNALIGNPPAPLDPTPVWFIEGAKSNRSLDYLREAYRTYSRLFDGSLAQIKTRLGLLQPRLPNQKSPFVTLRDGVSYRFRCSRQVASPFDQVGEPIPGCETRKYPKDGLRGGVDWGFTSRNIYTEVLQSGPSSSGFITNPSFTALGGNGFQKASFAGDKSSIFSDTYLGRTFFYSLERIGRIGMLWNTAKHVIIFERSVVHTQQFPDENHNWLGRPVVRKVREFVEILQPERSYPEFGEAPVVRGFARGSKFPHPVINVDSAWGRDIPGGWIVPLHNPSANQNVYPFPQVLLKLTTSDKQGALPLEVKKNPVAVKEEGPFIWGSVTNPEDLVFYTSTNPNDDAKTDSWNPAPGVDYPVAAIPTNDPKENDNDSVTRGYDRFSLRINTGGTPVNLLAERLSDISDAVVENITLVRRNLEEHVATAADVTQQNIDDALAQGKRIEAQLKQDIEAVLLSLRTPGIKLGDILKKIGALGEKAKTDIEGLEEKYKKLGEQRVISLISKAHASLKTAWLTRLNQLARGVHDDLAEIVARTTAETKAREDEIKELLQLYHRHAENANTLLDQFKESVTGARGLFDNLALAFVKDTGAVRKALNEAIDLVKEGGQFSKDKIPIYRQQILAILSSVESNLATARNQLAGIDHELLKPVNEIYSQLVGQLLPVHTEFPLTQDAINKINESANHLKEAFDTLHKNLDLEAAEKFKQIQEKLTELQQNRKKLTIYIDETISPFLVKVKTFDKQALDQLVTLEDGLRTRVGEVFQRVEAYGADLKTEIEQGLGQFGAISKDVQQRIDRARDIAKKIADGLDGLDDLSSEVQNRIKSALNDVAQNVLGPVRNAVGPYEQWVKEAEKLNIPSLVTAEAEKLADRTLRLVRAHGLAPIGEAINLDKERVAYYFNERAKGVLKQLENAVDITPATAMVNHARDIVQANVKSLGIELPSRRIAEKFVPDLDVLKDLKFKDVFPDFAGINLKSIFSEALFPLTQSETVRITHGIDPSTYRPWAQCNVDLAMPGDAEVLSVPAVNIAIQRAKFTAQTRIAVDQAGGLKREVKAAIFGDWRLTVAGQRVMTIKNSTLHFDDSGKIKFDMGAKDIEMAEVMKFITDLLSTVNMSNKSGLSFELLKEGMIPVGARASLNLALPALQLGAFSISNLALTALFEIAFRNGDFYIATGLGLATKERPFNLSVMCLGGGGWLTVKVLYVPQKQIMALLSIGISAGASLPFDIGVASGGIYILLGLGVEFLYGGGGGSLTILLRISISGELNILGIISVGVMIALEARYGQGSLVCSGTLRVSIKICWCFTLSVSAGFSITLAGSGGQSAGDLVGEVKTPRERITDAVTNYIASFGE